MRRNRLLLLLFAVLFLFSGCTPVKAPSSTQSSLPLPSPAASSPAPAPSAEPTKDPAKEEPSVTEKTPQTLAEEKLKTMTLEERVGQMFCLAFRKTSLGFDLQELDQKSRDILQTVQPGGLVLFSENVDSAEQIRTFISDAQELSNIPLFVSIDQEGGRVQRIKHTDKIPATDIPPMLTVGKQNDLTLTRRIGGLIAQELRVFGFNMDFAPCCDVFSNPENTVIGDRAFSSDPQIAAEQAAALADGLSEEGIIPVLKHFPGHGDTAADTHDGLAVNEKTEEELRDCELIPFQKGIEEGAQVIMAAHISLPEITGDMTPASLSKTILTGLLREKMGYDGIIMTDSLEMGAITGNYSVEEYIKLGIDAGVDIFLMPANPEKAFQTLVSYVQKGEIPLNRIDESVLRILTLKYEYELFEETPLPDESVLGSRAGILDAITEE